MNYFIVARITSKSVSEITPKGITSEIQCFKIRNVLAIDVIPVLNLDVIP